MFVQHPPILSAAEHARHIAGGGGNDVDEVADVVAHSHFVNSPAVRKPIPIISDVAELPNGWHHLHNCSLREELDLCIPTLKAVPNCIRAPFARIQCQVLHAIVLSYNGDSVDFMVKRVDSWCLWCLLPRLLLFQTKRGGDAGIRLLKRRISLFDTGKWDELLVLSRTSISSSRPPSNGDDNHLVRACNFVKKGEVSHAARCLGSAGLAAGTPETLAELSNPALRPACPNPEKPIPIFAEAFQPEVELMLDYDCFAGTLQKCRRGLSPGLNGGRYEYLKLVLDDDSGFRLLFYVCERLANGDIPEGIPDILKVGRLTALRKPNGKVRGISAGDILRRLVAKVLARQFQPIFRKSTSPFNFGLSNRAGTDSLVHFVRFLLDEDPSRVVVSIDGIGAFDHVERRQIFSELFHHDTLKCLMPFVRLWYLHESVFYWFDDNGKRHTITQGDGGEQGDALMPGLFSLALHPALVAIQAELGPDCFVVAYLDDIYI